VPCGAALYLAVGVLYLAVECCALRWGVRLILAATGERGEREREQPAERRRRGWAIIITQWPVLTKEGLIGSCMCRTPRAMAEGS
jgi:hypothetical protein